MTENKSLRAYLLLAFAIAWALQVIASIMLQKGFTAVYSMILAVSMFAPLVAALISKSGVRKIGWKPRFKGRVRFYLAAWLLPVLLGSLGAAIYFLLFPAAFDAAFSYVTAQLGAEGIAALEESGMTLSAYVAAGCISSVTCAPWMNMLFAVGEEAGWRGVMYPALKERFGTTQGRMLGGAIWGVWHWPVMLLAGYEYGTAYPGSPVLGPLLFCLIAAAMGVLLDALYEKTECIWAPALCHGAINAFAGVPTLFLAPEWADRLILGPLMIGIIGGIPLIAAAILISVKAEKQRRKQH